MIQFFFHVWSGVVESVPYLFVPLHRYYSHYIDWSVSVTACYGLKTLKIRVLFPLIMISEFSLWCLAQQHLHCYMLLKCNSLYSMTVQRTSCLYWVWSKIQLVRFAGMYWKCRDLEIVVCHASTQMQSNPLCVFPLIQACLIWQLMCVTTARIQDVTWAQPIISLKNRVI